MFSSASPSRLPLRRPPVAELSEFDLTPSEVSAHARAVEGGPFWKLLGMKVEMAEKGRSLVTMPVRDGLLQLYGYVHGGALASLVDGAVGVAVQSTLQEGEATTTVDLQVMYSRPVQSGLLSARAEIVRRGNTIVFGACRVTDEAGKLVAHGSATYMILEQARWQVKS